MTHPPTVTEPGAVFLPCLQAVMMLSGKHTACAQTLAGLSPSAAIL